MRQKSNTEKQEYKLRQAEPRGPHPNSYFPPCVNSPPQPIVERETNGAAVSTFHASIVSDEDFSKAYDFDESFLSAPWKFSGRTAAHELIGLRGLSQGPENSLLIGK